MCGELFCLVVRKKIFKQSIARKWLPKENYFGRWILRPAYEDWALLAFPQTLPRDEHGSESSPLATRLLNLVLFITF